MKKHIIYLECWKLKCKYNVRKKLNVSPYCNREFIALDCFGKCLFQEKDINIPEVKK